MIRILLVEDQEVVREGIKAMLETKSDFHVVGEAGNGQQALDQIEVLQQQGLMPEVILMDIRMPVMDGVKATQLVSQNYSDAKVLVFTTFDDTQYVVEALKMGAKGYLLKNTPLEELAEVIRSVHRGYTQFGPGVLERMIASASSNLSDQSTSDQPLPSGFGELSPREKQVLRLIVKGSNSHEIAQTLFLTEGTVRNHISHILTRLHVRDRIQAAIVAAPFLNWLETD